MSAAEQGGMSWEDRLREARKLLDQAAKMPDAIDREAAAVRTVTTALLDRTDQLAVTQLWGVVKASGLLTREAFNGAVKDRRQAERDAHAANRSLAAVLPIGDDIAVPPPHEIGVSAVGWRYAEGADAGCGECAQSGYERGVYHFDQGDWRWLAPLPWCHNRIVVRDGARMARAGLSYLLSAAADGPRLVITHRRIREGTWANELGLALPDDRKVTEAAGTAIRALGELAPELESVPRLSRSGGIDIPPAECMPAGYLSVPEGADQAEALALWANLASLAAQTPALAHMLGASAFAPFVGPLKIQSHWIDAYGDSDKGKSTALRLAAAVWGDSITEGGTFRLWNYAPVGLIRALGELGILPMFVDESGASGYDKKQWKHSIYRTTGGTSRTGAERDGNGNRVTLPWRGTLFVTGNERLIDGITTGDGAGIPKRVIESQGPFTVDAPHAEAIDALVALCYGYPGREILSRYSAADARRFVERAAELVPLPAGDNPRTWGKQLQGHVAGALMLDEILPATLDGGIERPKLAPRVAEFAFAYLAERCAGPEHDGDRLLADMIEAQAREPARWPTVAEYRANRGGRDWSAGGAVAELPKHGVDRSIAGVRADDGSWFAVFPRVLAAEFVEPLGIDQSRALRELHVRGVLRVPPSVRAKGNWIDAVRLMPNTRKEPMYRFALPDDDDDDQADDLPPALPANDISSLARAHANAFAENHQPGQPAQVKGAFTHQPAHQPAHQPGPPETPTRAPETPPAPADLGDRAAARAAYAAEAGVPVGEVGDCARCSAPTRRYGPQGRPTCAACSPPAEGIEGEPRPTSPVGKSRAGDVGDQAPAPAPPARAEARRVPFLVLDDGRAHGPEGVVIEAPALADYARCGDVGRLAALGLRLGADRLWITSAVREALGLPAELPPAEHARCGFPHPWVEGASPEQWDVWPNDPAGLGEWMTVYRVPRSGEGVAIAFAEYMPPVSDSAPLFGELPPAALAHALTLLWQSSTYDGKGGRYGGAHYYRSPAAWFGRLVDMAARRARGETPEAVELPPPFGAQARRGAPPLILPKPYMAPPREIPAGYLLAELDVRSAYLSAANGTPVGFGAARKLRPGEISKRPGIHLCRAPVEAACFEPSLMPFFPPTSSRRQSEVGAWLDTAAAAWLAERGVPLRVDESYVWDDARRPFDSINERLGAARDQLAADASPPAQLAAAVIKAAYARYLGGWLGSDFGGDRPAGDWQANRHAWLAIRIQAEVRKQRNAVLMIGAGVLVLGGDQVDSLYVAAPSAEQLAAAPGTGGRRAVRDGRGGFAVKASATVTPELAAALADQSASAAARRLALRGALGDQAASNGQGEVIGDD